MVHWYEFTLDSVQAVMFTPLSAPFATGRSVAVILRQFGELFDGPMQALPLPDVVSAEIPRVVLKSTDDRRQLGIGPARFDYTWNNLPGGDPLDLGETVNQVVELFVHYVQETKVPVGRLALILSRTLPIANPAQVLIERFCTEQAQQEPFNRSANFEIHNHKDYKPQRVGVDYQINSWVRCKSAARKPDNYPLIQIVQDLNTIASEMEHRRFTIDQIRSFYDVIAGEANQIIRKYFPE